MDAEALSTFLDVPVKLVLKPHFILRGRVKQIFSDSIIFETVQTTSAISLERVLEISLDHSGR